MWQVISLVITDCYVVSNCIAMQHTNQIDIAMREILVPIHLNAMVDWLLGVPRQDVHFFGLQIIRKWKATAVRLGLVLMHIRVCACSHAASLLFCAELALGSGYTGSYLAIGSPPCLLQFPSALPLAAIEFYVIKACVLMLATVLYHFPDGVSTEPFYQVLAVLDDFATLVRITA